MKDAWYVVPSMIHDHDVAADITLLVTSAISASTWAWPVRHDEAAEPPGWLRTIVVIFALVSVGAIAYTSLLGGSTVHEPPKRLAPPP